jgi:phosphotransferase system enzyme I (PtsI)
VASLAIHGIGVSRGYAIGRVYRLQRAQAEIVEYSLPAEQIDSELTRYQTGLDLARAELRAIRERIPTDSPTEVAAFIDSHLLMLGDSLLAKAPLEIIRAQHCNAEWALKTQRDRIVQVFEEMDDEYLRTRRDDVDHVVDRIQNILLSGAENPLADTLAPRCADRIIIADDLTPADTILMRDQGVLAFVTEYGGPLSHTAILARSLGIPAIVGARQARRYLRDEELVVLDGDKGVIHAGLDEPALDFYRARQQQENQRQADLIVLSQQPARTRDGVPVALHANVERPEDSTAALQVAADGVGLYRTEFLFMNRAEPPDEEEQFIAYRDVLIAMAGRPVTVRSLDVGADKQVDGGRVDTPLANNPALGLRGLRLCLREPGLFRPQLRAILRASHYGPLRLMLPMLSSLQELQQTYLLLAELKQELREQGLDFNDKLAVGGMVEVPAVAVCAPLFARQLDFFSIGTNDLIQYALAIDRIDDDINYLYDPLHPAVLHLIHMTLRAGQAAGIPVSLCGEMAGEPRYTRLLLGLGLTEFSMHSARLPEVKHVITQSDQAALQIQVDDLLQTHDATQFMAKLLDIVESR